MAREPGRSTDDLVKAVPCAYAQGDTLLLGLVVDEKEATPSALLIRRQEGKRKIPVITGRGREVLRMAEEKRSSTSTAP